MRGHVHQRRARSGFAELRLGGGRAHVDVVAREQAGQRLHLGLGPGQVVLVLDARVAEGSQPGLDAWRALRQLHRDAHRRRDRHRMRLDDVAAVETQRLERQVMQRPVRHEYQPLARLQGERAEQRRAELVGIGDGRAPAAHHGVAEAFDQFGQVVALDVDAGRSDAVGPDDPGLQRIGQAVELHHALVGLERALQRGEIDRGHRLAADCRAATHRVEQRTRAAALADLERSARVAHVAVEADAALEHRLQVGEQAHLEFFAAELRADAVDAAERMADRIGRGLLVAEREFALRDAVPGPQLVVARVGADLARGELQVGVACFGRLVLGQQQARAGAVDLGGELRVARRRHRGEDLPCARRIAGIDQHVDQRGLHQRRIARRAAGQRGVVAGDGRCIVAAPGEHVAEHLVGRPDHELRVARRMTQCFACEFFGLVELARVAVDDRQVAVGEREQVRVARRVRQVQRLARGPHALAKLAGLGQRDGLAAVLVAGQLDAVLRIQHRAVVAQRKQRVAVGQPRLLLLAGDTFGVGRLGLRMQPRTRLQRAQPDRDGNAGARGQRPAEPRNPFHSTPAHGLRFCACRHRRRGSARLSGLVRAV